MKISTFFLSALFAITLFSGCAGMMEEVPAPDSVAHVSNRPQSGLNTPTTGIATPRGNAQQAQQTSRSTCQYRGIVTEMRGQDDCEFLISLENGDRIVPVEIERAFFNLRDAQMVILDYRPAGIRIGCQLGTPAIITCIQEI
jgi:hypothetical protein